MHSVLTPLAILLAVTGAAAGPNPYHIAGYISPAQLAQFGFPAGSACYDWNNLRADIPYQMVRPQHYIYRWYVPGGDYAADWRVHSATAQPREWFTQQTYPTETPWSMRQGMYRILVQYWGYHVDRARGEAQVGLPLSMQPQWYVDEGGSQQQRFAAWIETHPGMTWLLGNEPGCESRPQDVGGQDALTDREYATFFHDYHVFVRAHDAGARFANGALAMTTTPTWNPAFRVEEITADWSRVLDIYATSYGEEMPIDIWNIHLYNGAWSTGDNDAYRAKFTAAIETFRAFVNGTRGGIYRRRPMILTEFNGTYDTGSLTQENGRLFLLDFQHDLHRLWGKGVLDDWFWFVSYDNAGWGYCSILAPDRQSLSLVGAAYRDAAVAWEAGHPSRPALDLE